MWDGASGPLEQAALLVLLTGAAGTRVVPSHLLPVGGPGLRARRGGPGVMGHAGDRRLLPGHADLEELLDRRLLQAADHLLEHVEGFLLVLGQRVPLPVAAEADAF